MSAEQLLEQLTAAKKKVVTDGYEMSLGEISSLYKNNELIINPVYQRLIRWDASQKTRFIESILLGIPVPPIFVFQRDDGTWELIDGLQRISTVLHLMGILSQEGQTIDPLILEGTNLLPALAGMKWINNESHEKSFNIALQLEVKRARMRVEILRKESDQDTKFELFQRLNTGGSKLSEQEVRNSVMVMINPDFFQWIKSLSTFQNFVDTIQITETQLELAQDSEMALRFVAYRLYPYERGLDVNEYLDVAARNLCALNEAERATEKDNFEWTFNLLTSTIGNDVFKRWDGTRHTGRALISAFDTITYGISSNRVPIDQMPDQDRNEWIKNKIYDLWTNEHFLQFSGQGVRGTTRLSNLLPFSKDYFNP